MQHRSEETRSHILNAALKCFSQHGYEATGVAEICEAAGVSKGAFYHHFPTKQAVFLELLNTWLSSIGARLESARMETRDVPTALIQMGEMTGDVFEASDDRLAMFLEFWMQASRDARIWQTTIAPYRTFQAFFTQLIETGIRQGSLRPVDPAAAAHIIMAMGIGMLLQGLMEPQGAPWDQMMLQGIEFLLEGIKKKEPAEE